MEGDCTGVVLETGIVKELVLGGAVWVIEVIVGVMVVVVLRAAVVRLSGVPTRRIKTMYSSLALKHTSLFLT